MNPQLGLPPDSGFQILMFTVHVTSYHRSDRLATMLPLALFTACVNAYGLWRMARAVHIMLNFLPIMLFRNSIKD